MKNLYVRTTTVFFFCILYAGTAKTQGLYKVPLEEKINNSSFILEGKVVSQQSFWNPPHTMIYTASKVEVYKLFKGNLNKTHVEILTSGGSVGKEAIETSDLLQLSPNQIGVFFCYPNTINLLSPQTKEILFDVYSSAQGFFSYDLPNQTASAPFVTYADIITELYAELEVGIGKKLANKNISFSVSAYTTALNAPSVASITSLSPTLVNAGATLDPANNLLTINGSGFDNTPAALAAIRFDNPDNGAGGTPFLVPFNDPLVVSWTDTKIEVRVPGKAGTGNVEVVDNTGALSNSIPLDVRFSVSSPTLNSGGLFTKEANLMNDNGSGGYTVQFSTSTAGSGIDLSIAAQRATFERALTTWKEVAGLNVIVGTNTANQVVNPSDGLNVIMFDNANTGNAPLPSGTLAVCYSFYSACLPLSTNSFQTTEFDIVIRNSGFSIGTTTFTVGPCPPLSSSTSEIDLETVLLHELGHAIGLQHIIDPLQGMFIPNLNPAKLMHFAVTNSVRRSTPDYSALTGARYLINPQANTYGICGLASGEMTPLTATTESKDECPIIFPVMATPGNTNVSFDLIHATSNKLGDPSYTQLNCAGTGTGVTNTAYYAIKTNAVGGILGMSISGYTTSPSALASCPATFGFPATGVEVALYEVNACPIGQSFPAPVACRTFTGNGAISNIAGLAANTTYLIVADGIENTKASFTLTFTGAALPINFSNFYGEVSDNYNMLHWLIEYAYDVKKVFLEKSVDGINFDKLGEVTNSLQKNKGSYTDVTPNNGDNYYRLCIENLDNTKEYSKIVLLKRNDPLILHLFPNPVSDILNIEISADKEDRYSLTLYNQLGQALLNREISVIAKPQIYKFNISQLPVGMYHLQLRNSVNKILKNYKINTVR
jgi:hypothetical protein